MASNATDAPSYKQLKEDFVSNLSGGPVSEINYVTAIAPVRRVDAASGLALLRRAPFFRRRHRRR